MARRLTLSAAISVFAAAALAVPAQASFDPHFRVLTKTVHHHSVGHGGDAFYEKVLDPKRPQNKVGEDHGRCRPDGPVAFFCKATFHLSGEIGGHGDITVKGKIFQGQPTLKVVDGTDNFQGVHGTLTLGGPSDLGNSYGFNIFDLH